MVIDKTKRSNIEDNRLAPHVGPGCYELANKIDRSIPNPTIPRGGAYTTVKKRIKNRGTIRAEYEEGDTTSDEEPLPGPGNYLK